MKLTKFAINNLAAALKPRMRAVLQNLAIKVIMVACSTIIMPCLQAQATVISDAATALSPGQWSAPITTGGVQGGNIFKPHNGAYGTIFEYMDKALWNPINLSVMLGGGFHGSPPDGTQDDAFVIYTTANDAWRSSCDGTGTLLCFSTTGLPGPYPLDSAYPCPGPGGGCGTAHQYHHNTINPITGDVYHGQYGGPVVLKFSHASQTWSACSSLPENNGQGALEYFPERNSLVFHIGYSGVYELSLASGNCTSAAWVQRAGAWFPTPGLPNMGQSLSGYHIQSMYSAACTCVLFVGQDSGNMWRMNSDATFAQGATAPVTPGIAQGSSGAIFTKDPVSQKILVWHTSNGATTMYEYAPATNIWATISRAAPMFPGGIVYEVAAAPISTHGVIMFMSFGQIRLYKHAAGVADVTAPSAPSGLTVTPFSSSQLNLSWTASTDAIGVTGYRVERSPAGCGSFTEVGTPSGTTFNDTGRTASTTYCYKVRATDAAGNLSGYSSNVSGTTLAADTTAPSIPTNLIAAATSASQINLTWTASTDAVGVTGYRLERCTPAACVNFLEIGTPPANSFSDTGLTASTLYRYRVRATDAAGNLSGYSTISQATTSAVAVGGDFAARCAAAGVVKCWAFNQAVDLGTICGYCNVGIIHNAQSAQTSEDGVAFDGSTCNTRPRVDECPTIDAGAPGGPAMKFEVKSQTGAGVGGQWYGNFSTNYGSRFGASSSFWIQYRVYMTPELLTTKYNSNGFKLASIATGDQPIGTTTCPDGAAGNLPGFCTYTSCTALDIPLQNNNQRGFPQMYHSCTGSSSHGPYLPWETAFFNDDIGFSDISFQERPSPYCSYLRVNGGAPGVPAGSQFPPTGNCVPFVASEWVAFTFHLTLGPRGSTGIAGASPNDEFVNSLVEAWVTRENGTRQKIYNHTLNISASSAASNQTYGKVFLLPYQTGKDPSQVTPVASLWYKELIVSTQAIADPGPGGGPVALVAPTNVSVTTP